MNEDVKLPIYNEQHHTSNKLPNCFLNHASMFSRSFKIFQESFKDLYYSILKAHVLLSSIRGRAMQQQILSFLSGAA